MSCNCKGARKMQEIYGEVPTNENSLDKLIRYTKRFFNDVIYNSHWYSMYTNRFDCSNIQLYFQWCCLL